MVSGMNRMPEGVFLMIQTVKLAKLRLSPINVRTAPDKELALDSLAADIKARGVLQNLLITPARKPKGVFEVFDGGRRLRALNMLAKEGVLNVDDYDVPVMVLKADDAALSETSLAANFHQLRLTPAEECRAFQHFLGVDGDIDAVATRFGQTRRFIEGRLRLATLAEPIFDALAEGKMTLDMAKAYASTENQEKQLLIFNTYGFHGYVTPDTVRRAIANETMKATDPIALLVGEDDYVAAGGRIDRDLFSDTGDRWVNPEIAQKLAGEKMEAEAERIGRETGLAWIRPIATHHTYNAAADLYRVALPTVPMTEQEQARAIALDERLAALESAMEDEDLADDAYEILTQEVEALELERSALHNRPAVLTDELRPLVGAFLLLTPGGELSLDTIYYAEQPIRVDNDGRPTQVDESNDEGANGDRTRGGGQAAPPEAVAPGGKPLSARLYDELAIQRRDVLAANLVQHPGLALDYAIFAMVDARNCLSGNYGTTIRARAPEDPAVGELPATHARDYLAKAHDGLATDWMAHDSIVERFEAFRELDDDSKAGWLAYVVAVSLQAKDGYAQTKQNELHNRLASIMEVNVPSWWRPTSENFFDRVPKGALLSLLHEVGGPALSGRYAASKKTEISASCHKLFAGEAIVEAEVKEAALAWVPDAMRFLDKPTGEAVEPRGPDEDEDPRIDDHSEADGTPAIDDESDRSGHLPEQLDQQLGPVAAEAA